MRDEVALRIGGRDFLGWETARVTVSIESGSGSFGLSVSETLPRRQTIRPGMEAEIRIGSSKLIRGYVNEVTISLEAASHTVSVSGRDRLADLIDCSPDIGDPSRMGPPSPGSVRGEWANFSLLDLAKELAAPFGVDVTAHPAVGGAVSTRYPKVSLTPGQRPFDLIEERCRFANVLPVSDGVGGLLFTIAGTSRVKTPLVEGQNILSASVTYSEAERFQTYVVKGQDMDSGLLGGAASGESVGRAVDPDVARHRPLLIQADQAVDAAACGKRARWECLTRAARATRVQLEVQGWRQPGGALWPLNALVPVRSPSLGVDGELLITEVTYSLPSSVTSLTLMRPDAFLPQPFEEIESESGLDFLT